jgi:hypothetical protein
LSTGLYIIATVGKHRQSAILLLLCQCMVTIYASIKRAISGASLVKYTYSNQAINHWGSFLLCNRSWLKFLSFSAPLTS